MLNVFDDQRFLVRRTTPDDPVGHRVSRSFRELVTMPDNPDERLRFDYPLEYMNMAALGLCTALLQVAFEPADVEALAARIETPLSPEEFEGGVAPFRGLFTIDGPSGTRFLQGAEPPRDKKGQLGGGSLSDLLVTVKKGDKEFLNRPNDQWVVRLDQIPLLLFSRATYYEKSAGRGYYTGTSSDLEIRTYPVDPASLRRTIWMNVLCSEAQPAGDFIGAGSGEGYDGWMWHQLPSSQEIPKGRISLRSGLLWMIANMFIEIEEVVEPRPCIVTGDMISGRAGTSVVVSSAGYGYGVRVAREKGPDVRDSFFLHPNGPYFFRGVKEGKPYPTHLSVAENSGIFGHMAGLFFAADDGDYQIAPVVEQLYDLNDLYDDHGQSPPWKDLVLVCFGFHMRSQKKNIHSGYEYEAFNYSIIGRRDDDAHMVLTEAHAIMADAARVAQAIDKILTAALQVCMLIETEAKESNDRRTVEFNVRSFLSPTDVAPSISREYWNRLGVDIRQLIERINRHGDTREELQEARDTILTWWRGQAATHARDLFTRIFSDFATTPAHFLAAHSARRLFYGRLHKELGIRFQRMAEQTTAVETQDDESTMIGGGV